MEGYEKNHIKMGRNGVSQMKHFPSPPPLLVANWNGKFPNFVPTLNAVSMSFKSLPHTKHKQETIEAKDRHLLLLSPFIQRLRYMDIVQENANGVEWGGQVCHAWKGSEVDDLVLQWIETEKGLKE